MVPKTFFYKNIVKTDGSGNIYVAGATMNGSGTTDVLLSKKNSLGVTLWTQQLNGLANAHDFATDIVIDGSGNVFVTGAITNNTVTQLPDMMLLKYNSSGALQFNVSYDGSGNLYDAGTALGLDGSGNIYITGAGYNGSLNTDVITLKYNSSGTLQWAQAFDYGLNDAAVKLYIEGSSVNVSGGIQTAATNYAMGILVYNTSTGSLTSSAITSTLSTSADLITGMDKDALGNIYLTGAVPVPGNGLDYITVKFNSGLAVAWSATYNGSNLDDIAKAVKVDASGNVYVTGYTTGANGRDYTTVKYNSSGTQQWVKNYNHSAVNGNDEAADLVIDNNNDIYVTGSITDNLHKLDYYTIKYDPSGNVIWDIQSDGFSTDDKATNMALDSLNNVIVTGQTEMTPGNFVYGTIKYVQRDVITPTDFNGESPATNFMFYQNKGQIVDTNYTAVADIKYYTHNTYPAFYFKNRSQSFVFARIDTVAATADTLHRIDLSFERANEAVRTYALEKQENGYLNYFLGHLDSNGVTGVQGHKRLITPELYPNIDLMTTSNQNGIKYYFIVKPGGDMRDIAMEFTGATSFSLNGTTNHLNINSSIGSLTFDKPVAYQLTAGNTTVAVTSFSPTWVTNGAANKYKFNNGAYTSSLTLVIQVDQGNGLPSLTTTDNLKWSTYLGKSNLDMIHRVRTNSSNNLFAVGQSYSAVFPQGNGVFAIYQPNNKGSIDGFISKFSPVGELIWSTFVGGLNSDNLTDVAFHSNGDLYCVGNTNSSNLLTVSKAGADNDTSFTGPVSQWLYYHAGEGFIFQLSQDGLTNPWLRYYGGDYYDVLTGCAMDVANNFFIVGSSASSNIPVITPSGTYNKTNSPIMPWTNTFDGIVARFNSSSVITWATYIGSTASVGGPPDDRLYDIVISDDYENGPQDFYIGGTAYGTNYPNVSTSSPSSSNYSGQMQDGVVTRFKNNGQIVWSTYLTGTGSDAVSGLAYHNGLYVVGQTYSSDFLTINSTNDYYQDSYGGNSDAFFVKVNSNNVITHSTYLGGIDYEDAMDIAFDPVNKVSYICGMIEGGNNFPVPASNPANTYEQNYSGGFDNYLCALKDNSTSILWATYLGGSGDECIYNVAGDAVHQSVCIDGNQNLFLGSLTQTKETATIPFPLNDNGGFPTYFQPNLAGTMDATITKFDLVPINLVSIKENRLTDDGFILFPNPTNNYLFIKIKSKVKPYYKIVNPLGQIVKEGRITSEVQSIDVSSLSTGVYLIELWNENSNFSSKFIKHD